MTLHEDRLPCILFSCRDDGTLVEVNGQLCEKLGYYREELIGRPVEMIFTLATRMFQQTHFLPLLKLQGLAEEIYITLQSRDRRKVPVLINAERREVDGERLNTFVGILVHNREKFENELIAAKKAAESALQENTALLQAKQELQQNLEQMDRQMHQLQKKNEELRQFSRVVTHDLQEPLRKMSLLGNVLAEAEGQPVSKDTVAKLLHVSGQMRSRLSGLQQYVWLTEAGRHLTLVELTPLIARVRQQLAEEHPDVQLIVEGGDAPPVPGDRDQIQLLFYHLLSNAVRFRKVASAAYVTIRVNTLMVNQFRNLRDKYKYAEYLKVEVEDRGIGFEADHQAQVFDLFRRLHPVSGSGVGLALCRKIIDNHDGTIAINSRPEEGTTVTLLLPLNPELGSGTASDG